MRMRGVMAPVKQEPYGSTRWRSRHGAKIMGPWIALVVTAWMRLAQPGFLVVKVVANIAFAPLQNAEVTDVDTGLRQFTDSSGVTRVRVPANGRLRLRIRQLGYKPAERSLEKLGNGPADDSLTVALERVVFALPEVVTSETRRCGTADALDGFRTVPALEQLRIAAERYESFRRAYPFHVDVVRRTVTVNIDGKPKSVRENKEGVDSDEWGDRYTPGNVVHHEYLGFSVPILFVAALADSSFWTHHCFSVRGIASLADGRAVRMDFAPAVGSVEPEWQGTVFIDSATSMLRRIDFSLTGLPQDESPRRFEGYTTFTSPSPYISIPDSTVAVWWRRSPSQTGEWNAPDVVQLIHVVAIRYKKAKPS
jgi:hypothetical protein